MARVCRAMWHGRATLARGVRATLHGRVMLPVQARASWRLEFAYWDTIFVAARLLL